jgi:hypothetical protein
VKPRLAFADEGAIAVSQYQSRVYSDLVDSVLNCWNTYGPVQGPSTVMQFNTTYREWYAATGLTSRSSLSNLNHCCFSPRLRAQFSTQSPTTTL